MGRAQTRSDKAKWKKKTHPTSKCKHAKCLCCHYLKILKIPSRKLKRQNAKDKILNNEI